LKVKALKHATGARNGNQQTGECGVWIDLHCVTRTSVCQANRNPAETVMQ
jgi:hypothetical protein